jgi:lipopolysaccharide export system ATP-binding protein
VLAVLEAMPYSRKERKLRAEELLDELDILDLAPNMADTLSGGERRRLEISRALATEPSALLLDEPFAGVAPIAVQEIQEIIAQLRERDIGILITDHNVRETLQSTDRAYVIDRGSILKEGTAEMLVADPKVREVYLGHSFDAPIQGVTAEEEMELLEEDFSNSGTSD